MQNELYRLTFCGNVLKITLGTQPRRPQLGSEGFPGSRLLELVSGGRPGKNDVMRCCACGRHSDVGSLITRHSY